MSDEKDEPIGVTELWGIPVLIEDSPMTRLHGYYFIGADEPEVDSEEEEPNV